MQRAVKNEWKLKCQRENENFDLMFDTHFQGFTPLRISDDVDCKIE